MARSAGQTQRFTIDIPVGLHHAMKVQAAVTGVPMVDEVTPLLEAHYAEALRLYKRAD